jgi:hypothetical protein
MQSKEKAMRDTIDMARKVYGANTEWTDSQLERLEAFADLVRADERARLQPKKIKAVQKDDYCYGDERYYANE